jgi:hypothetical protein
MADSQFGISQKEFGTYPNIQIDDRLPGPSPLLQQEEERGSYDKS